MVVFVLVALGLTLFAASVVLFAPRRRHEDAGASSQAQTSAAVLRQQLAELEGERARGLLDEGEFAQLRDELQRRLLADAAPRAAAVRPQVRPHRLLALYAAALPVAAVLLYLHFGHPQLLRSEDVTALAAADAAEDADDVGRLVARLEAHVAAEPGDARAWVTLGRVRMQRDQFEPAAAAYRHALDASPKVARDPLVWCEYADALGMAQGGRLAGRPRELIEKALALDGAHPRALEMAGSAAYEVGDFRTAVRFWRQLLVQLPAESGEHGQLLAAIARAEQRAKFSLPAS